MQSSHILILSCNRHRRSLLVHSPSYYVGTPPCPARPVKPTQLRTCASASVDAPRNPARTAHASCASASVGPLCSGEDRGKAPLAPPLWPGGSSGRVRHFDLVCLVRFVLPLCACVCDPCCHRGFPAGTAARFKAWDGPGRSLLSSHAATVTPVGIRSGRRAAPPLASPRPIPLPPFPHHTRCTSPSFFLSFFYLFYTAPTGRLHRFAGR